MTQHHQDASHPSHEIAYGDPLTDPMPGYAPEHASAVPPEETVAQPAQQQPSHQAVAVAPADGPLELASDARSASADELAGRALADRPRSVFSIEDAELALAEDLERRAERVSRSRIIGHRTI